MTWALENLKNGGDSPTDGELFGTGRYLTSKPECAASGTYALGLVDEDPTCTVDGHSLHLAQPRNEGRRGLAQRLVHLHQELGGSGKLR